MVAVGIVKKEYFPSHLIEPDIIDDEQQTPLTLRCLQEDSKYERKHKRKIVQQDYDRFYSGVLANNGVSSTTLKVLPS